MADEWSELADMLAYLIEKCVLLITLIRYMIKHDKDVQTIISENIK